MKRTQTWLSVACVALVVGVIVSLEALGAEGGKLPPEKTYSNTPFLHRIFLRDENEILITAPKPVDPKATGDAERAKPMSTATTCGKCHDYGAMSHGWHFNAWEKDVPAGRPGEPWLLTDPQTRTQLPLSYRGWKGTYHPHTAGINDYTFVRFFGRHLPGGGAAANSSDLRFKMSGKLEIDCLICHSIQPFDHVERARQITEEANFKWAPTASALLGEIAGKRSADLKDTWSAADPDAAKPAKVDYRADRFDAKNNVTFQVSRRVSNDKCFFCHTSVGSGHSEPGNKALETRWAHDRDIHLAKGMLCVDCHRNGVDHMTTRGYEGEYKDRADKHKDPAIMTLTCKGCHYGSESQGGRLAAPLPVHKGLPTLHFDKLSCTTCHSGPRPGDATTHVQTSLAHKLGLPRHHHGDDMAPRIQEAVFLVDQSDPQKKIAPHKLVYPSFWARLSGGIVTPIPPVDVVAACGDDARSVKPSKSVQKKAEAILGVGPSDKADPPIAPLTRDQVLQVLGKLASAKAPDPMPPAEVIHGYAPAASAHTTPATTQASSQPATLPAETAKSQPMPWYTGEPVFITGGKLYRRTADGKDLQAVDHEAARPYAWAIGHNVRSAQQALGATGCTDCHSLGAPLFDGKVASDSVIANTTTVASMHQLRGDSMGALTAFAATYPMRPILIATGYICAGLMGLLLLSYAGRAVSSISRRL